MKIGMLWYEKGALESLSQKVQKAVDYYREKYGRAPNRCFVHPSMLPWPGQDGPVDEQSRLIGPVELIGSEQVRPNHFWIGFQAVED